jgi:F420-dependent oxidoreductase-like protein
MPNPSLRIGALSSQMMRPLAGLDELADEASRLEALGLATFWLPNVFNFDALSALVFVATRTRSIELGTAVVPTPSRQPIAMAQQALTVQAASGGRLALGIGLSHRIVTEGMWGLSFAKPARQMREYLEALTPLLRCERADVEGEFYRVHTRIQVPVASPPPVILAAMGPRMLALAGERADGTIPWLCGPRTLSQHVVPGIRRAAERAGRRAPRVVVALPIALTADPAAAREAVSKLFAIYTSIPSYAGMLEREGVRDPADVALVGDERALREALLRLHGLGATDFAAVCVPTDPGAVERTLALLSDVSRSGSPG